MRRLLLLGLLALGVAAPPPAQAQPWPSRPVRLVVVFPPGGASDIAARVLAEALSARMGARFVVDNRAGAGSTIGTRSVVQARPDGHTVLMGSISFLTAPLIMQPMPFDPAEALRCVCLVSTSPYILVVRADSPWRSWRDYIAAAKAEPGRLTYSTSGIATSNHIAMDDILAREGAGALYKGGLAGAIAEDMRRNGGLLTGGDLAGFAPERQAPLEVGYRGWRYAGNRPPGGGALLQTVEQVQVGPLKSPSRRAA